jgi:hypothetical protein
MFTMTSCGKEEQKMHSLSLRDASLFLFFHKGLVQQYVPDVMSQYAHLIPKSSIVVIIVARFTCPR